MKENIIFEAPPTPIIEQNNSKDDCYTCTECSSDIEILSLNKEKSTIQFICLNKNSHGIKEMDINQYIKEMKKNTYLYNKCSSCNIIQKDKLNNNDNFLLCLKCNKIFCCKCFELHLNNTEDIKLHKEIKINELNIYCLKHSIKKTNNYVSYCFDCEEHLCKECLKSRIHINHKKNSIIEIQPTDEELLAVKEVIKDYNNTVESLIKEQNIKQNELKEELAINISNTENLYKKKFNIIEKDKEIELFASKNNYLLDIDEIKKKYQCEIALRKKEYNEKCNDIKLKYMDLNKKTNEEFNLKLEGIKLNNEDKTNRQKLNYKNKIDKIKIIIKISEIIYNTYEKYNDNYIYSININNLLLNYCKNDYIKNVVMKKVLKEQYDDIINIIYQKENENKNISFKRNEKYLKEIVNNINNKNENNKGNNKMTIIYDTKFLDEVQLFGYDFIKNNKDKCYLIINDQQKELCQFIYEKDYKYKRFLEVLLIEKEKMVDMSNMFNNCSSLFSLPDINKWDTTGVTNIESFFFNCSSLTILPDILNLNTSNVISLKAFFYNCSSLTVSPDISKWDTSNVTNMGWLFFGCAKLVSLPDISKWKTSKVINMQNMFSGCESIVTLPDLSLWDTSNVKNMGFLFSRCISLTSLFDISKWVINDAHCKKNLFKECKSLDFNKIPESFFEIQ